MSCDCDCDCDHLVHRRGKFPASFLAVALKLLHNPRFSSLDLEVRGRLPRGLEPFRRAKALIVVQWCSGAQTMGINHIIVITTKTVTIGVDGKESGGGGAVAAAAATAATAMIPKGILQGHPQRKGRVFLIPSSACRCGASMILLYIASTTVVEQLTLNLIMLLFSAPSVVGDASVAVTFKHGTCVTQLVV